MQILRIGEGETFTVYERQRFEVEHEEDVLEKWIVANPDVILEDEKMLVVGRQVRNDLGGVLDLLGLDREGNVVIVELKRDKTPRDVIAQALEYAAWAANLDKDQLEEYLRSFEGDEALCLAARHARHFELGDAAAADLKFNTSHRIVIIGQDVTDEIRKTADYLHSWGVPLECREFTFFKCDAGDSLLHLTTVIPEDKARSRGRSREPTDTQQRIKRFWAGLLEHAKSKTQRHAKCSPTEQHFLPASARVQIHGVKLNYYYYLRADSADVAFDITGQERKRIFDALQRDRVQIEGRFGSKLSWDPKEGRSHCRISMTYDGGYEDEERWGAVFDELASAMASLESALQSSLRGLQRE